MYVVTDKIVSANFSAPPRPLPARGNIAPGTAEIGAEWLYTLMNSISDAVFIINAEQHILSMNSAAEVIVGMSATDVRGYALDDVMSFSWGKKASDEKFVPLHGDNNIHRLCAMAGRQSELTVTNRYGDYRSCGIEMVLLESAEPEQKYHALILNDLSSRSELETAVQWFEHFDALTGLSNRAQLVRRLEERFANGREAIMNDWLLYISLDHFRPISDSVGAEVGDDVLKRVADLFRATRQPSEFFARVNGDEFCIHVTNAKTYDVKTRVRELIGLIKNLRFTGKHYNFNLTASGGLIQPAGYGGDVGQVITAARNACSAARVAGGDQYSEFTGPRCPGAQVEAELATVAEVKRALLTNSFELFAQPVVGSIPNHGPDPLYYELLIRMVDRERNLLFPSTFISVAEKFNLMGQVDRWVIDRAFAMLSDNFGLTDDVAVGVNLSGCSMADPELERFVMEKVRQYEVSPHCICFEITETAAVNNLEQAANFVSSMRSLGFRFALDDFGSGMASFAYIKQLAVNYLKIDGSFVHDLNADESGDSYSILSTIQHMADAMCIPTIAESVESEAIVETLRKLGVSYLQGYHIQRPKRVQTVLDLQTAEPDVQFA